MKNKLTLLAAAACIAALTLTSCGTSRKLQSAGTTATRTTAVNGNSETVKMNFLRKVTDNEVYSPCITAKIKFTLDTGDKNISVSGSLRMKKDDVIRIQLTPFGLMEAGRMEFTKDYVLIVDRLNKRYVKEDYTKVDFLNRNGLDFYALQALFWNQLYMPGAQKVSDSALGKYKVTFNDAVKGVLIQYVRGNMDYAFTADEATGHITKTDVTYSNAAEGKTQLVCSYGAFRTLQTKQFPTDINMTVKSDRVKRGRPMSVSLVLSSLGTDSNWEPRTEVSAKYRKVTAEEVMKMLSDSNF